MDPITQAYAKLQADYGTLQGDYATKQTTALALANAQHADDVAANAIVGDSTQVNGDKEAFKALIDNSFPVPPTPPTAAVKAA